MMTFNMPPRPITVSLVSGAVLAGLLVATAQSPAAQAPYYPPAGQWARKAPADVGMDAAKLEAAIAFAKTRETNPQKELENSQQQFRNVWGAFEVSGELPPGEPVLLVDDLADSRWTLTVAAAALLEAGSGPVSPFVLAKAVND